MDEENNNDATFDPAENYAQGESLTKSNVRSISQAITLDRTFVSKGENIEVYKTDASEA